MTTPAFVPQNGSTLTTVRYYTAADPYYYSVDNRPLTDLNGNILALGSGSGDSSRRAVLLDTLANNQAWSELFKAVSLTQNMASGLQISQVSAGVVSVGQGSIYELEPVNAGLSTPILKQALLLTPFDLSVPAPSTAGQSINYLVQYQINDLTDAWMTSGSALPYVDGTNTFLPCLLMNKELTVSVVAGTAAATGSQTTPAATTGQSPLYVITSTYGNATPTVTIASGAPVFRGGDMVVTPVVPATGGPVTATVAGLPTLQFQKSGTETVAIPVDLNKLDPYSPLTFKLIFSSDTAGGSFGIQASYGFIAIGGSTTAGLTGTAVETMPLSVSSDAITEYQTAAAVVPNTVFAGFNSSVWSVNTGFLALTLQRVGGAGNDTNSGNLYLHKVYLSQNTY
jgi:hypothetical protein